METEHFQEFSRMLTLTAEQYGRSVSPELVRFYFEGLRHLEFDAVRCAFNAHVRNPDAGRFMPRVADIIRAVEPDTVEEDALEALRLMSREDPITNRVIESMGGWRAHGQREEQEWQRFGQPEFLRRYAIYSRREKSEQKLLESK